MKAALVLALLAMATCGPRPEELADCRRICEPMAWEVPEAGVCHCFGRQRLRDGADAGGGK